MTRHLLVAALALTLLALPACGGDGAEPESEDFPPTETGVVPGGGFTEDQVELAIENQETNDIIGTAIFSPEDAASTRVVVLLDEPPEGGGEMEIRAGRCEEPEAEVTHELGEFAEAEGEAVVETSLEDLMAAPHALWTVAHDDSQLGCSLIAPFGVDLD